jgi:2',3'-cyclic-nucleotide 2'-phosphodiesterase (5'-nucleotidase family)
VARRATAIDRERETHEFVLVVDAGNSLTGDQDPARTTQGQTSVTAMNLMHYDAVGLGPTDLALGLETLRQRMAEAEFPMLSANAVVSDAGESIADPYVLREFDGHTIAIVAISGGDVSGGSGTQRIAVRDPLETARTLLAEVTLQADVVILLSTAGQETDLQIAETVPGIDLIISGDTSQLAAPWQIEKTGTLVLHADNAAPGHAGRNVGIAYLAFDQDGKLVEQEWQRLALGPEVASNPTIANWVQEQMAR